MSAVADSKQLITVMASLATAITSGVGGTVATVAASILSQIAADTGLTAQEKAILTSISSAVVSTQPSSSIHSGTL